MSDEYACEVCGAPLVHHGGPHRPRWCDEHRAEGKAQADRDRMAAQRARTQAAMPDPPIRCEGCDAQMLGPSDDGLCGFCHVEMAEAVAA